MSATLFWKLSDQPKTQEWLEKNLNHLLRTRPELNPLFDAVNNRVDHFFQLFFPQSVERDCYLANLSLQDDSERKISLSIRFYNHHIFNQDEYLPEHCSLVVIGYWNTRTNSPWFTPEKIMITHNDSDATVYEHEITCAYQQLGVGGVEYPPNGIQNALTRQLANDLPKISVETNKRLQDWRAFLQFKRNLIRQKTMGLRYIEAQYNPKTYQVQLLVVAENKEYLEQVRRAFLRQNLELFDLNISSEDWVFKLPEGDKDNKRTSKSALELGQISRGRNALELILEQQLKSKVIQNIRKEIPFDKPVFALFNIEVSEDWKNKLEKVDLNSQDEETLFNNQEIIDDFKNRIPEQGFISFSLLGDWALIERQERVIKNLCQNENCYSPYLSSYLFDITQAQIPRNLPNIQDWFNADLNDAQKRAVNKMLAAPDLCLIQGPPGTGKTTVIAEAILQFAKQGQTVLLASQAHDAIDNALSRIKNRPELRAIRLAKEFKGKSKITEDGQQFAGEQALARHYDALAQYVDNGFLKPLRDKQEGIKNLQEWLKQAEFLNVDMQKSQQRLQEITQQGKEKKQALLQAQQNFELYLHKYEQQQQYKQKMVQLCEFLQQKSHAPMDIDFPQNLATIVKTLFLLKDAQVKIPFTLSAFKDNPQSQMLILTALFDEWKKVQANIEHIQSDIQRLTSFGSGSLTSIETTHKIRSLEDEIESLLNQLDAGDDSVSDLWRSKRRELNQLKQSSDGLVHPCYQLFEDAEQFSNVQNAQNTAQILSQRLALFAQINHDLAIQTNHAIQELQQDIQKLQLNQPEDNLVKQLEREVETLRDDYMQQQDKQKKIQQKQLEYLQMQNSRQDFKGCITTIQEQIKNLENEYAAAYDKNKNWQPLFEQWHQILQQSKQESEDWEILQSTYIENCNLVAISCNENERTLTDAGLDGFDVVIIDEVSKATPLELLLPLMRARKAILVGDHRQLPPLFKESQDASGTFEDMVNEAGEDTQSQDTLLTKENFKRYEKMVTASLFKELFEKAPDLLRERLTVQFRMHPDIMKMINYFYEGQLDCGNPNLDRNHHITLKSKYNDLVTEDKHLLWVDTSYDEKGIACLDVDGSTNPTEAKLIAQVLVRINEQMRQKGFNSKNKYKVGVVSFYQAQCRTIREAIKKVNQGQIRFDAIDVEINTVIRYQGKEKPIILISLVRNDGKPKDHRRSSQANVARFEFINVAMSRAQNLLMVFGARNMLEMRDVILPKMDSQGSEKKKVYKDIFDRLDHIAQIYSTKEFVQACENR